jgi:outer membrane protein
VFPIKFILFIFDFMSMNKRLIVPFFVALCAANVEVALSRTTFDGTTVLTASTAKVDTNNVTSGVEKCRMLSMDEMFRLADANSRSVQAFSTAKAASEEALRAAKSQQLPDVSASLSMSYLGDGTIWNRSFGNGQSVHFPHFGNNFSLAVQQVIYAGGAIKSGIALGELEHEMATLDWEKNRQEIRFLLTGYYLDLYKLCNQSQVLQNNIELTQQIILEMEARKAQGTALQNDITRYELQKETLALQLAKVRDASEILNHKLVTTLHLPAGTFIQPDSALLCSEVQKLSEADWQQMAVQRNIALRQSNVSIKMSRQQLKMAHSELLPKISIMAEDHLDGPVTIEVPALNNNFNYWFVGVGLRYSLSSLFKKNHQIKQARLNVQRAEELGSLDGERVENEVQEGYVDYLTSFTDLHTQQKSVELANQNYHVTSNRYKNSLALLTDMLDASNMKLSAELSLVNARINVIYNYFKMKYLTHSL